MLLYVLLSLTVILGFYLAWTIGANDFANSMGDAVGSGALSIRNAVILGAVCEFAGSVLVGAHVTDTVRKGIVDPAMFAATPELLVLGMISALLACAIWVHMATLWGMPVSTTHSIVGAVAGFGILAMGWSSVEWGTMGEIALSWVISPVAGCVLAFCIFKLINWFILGRDKPVKAAERFVPFFVFYVVVVVSSSILVRGLDPFFKQRNIEMTGGKAFLISAMLGILLAVISRFLVRRYLRGTEHKSLAEQLQSVEKIFAPLVISTSCSVAFAHGANDVANAIGPVAAIADIAVTGSVNMKVTVPFWVLSLGGIGIIVGLATCGYRVLTTIGTKITQLTPSRGVAADLATATTVLVCSRLKLPVSTTHTIVGAIIGIGFARGLGAINQKVTRDIFSSWFITVPAAAVLSMIFFAVGRWLHVDLWIRHVFPAS